MKRKWNPDWKVAPAEILREWLDGHDYLEITKEEQVVIDRALSQQPLHEHDFQVLKEATGISTMFWSECERLYRRDIAKEKVYG